MLAGGDADGGGGGAVEKASDRLREANQLAMSLGELAGVYVQWCHLRVCCRSPVPGMTTVSFVGGSLPRYSMLEEAFMTVTITKATHEDEVRTPPSPQGCRSSVPSVSDLALCRRSMRT